MDIKATFDLTYGLFLIGTNADGKRNGCITNTVIQVGSDPMRVSLSCINGNLTPELIKKSGYFSVSILDKDTPFETFKNFGMQHGFDVDKFDGFETFEDANGCPYIKENVCSIITCKVVSSQDLGSHTLFIAEVTDAFKVGTGEPITYGYYQTVTKPQATQSQPSDKKIIGWKCTICGYVYEGAELPKDFTCPLCGHPASDFEPIYE